MQAHPLVSAAASVGSRQRRPGGWGALSQSKPADETSPNGVAASFKMKIAVSHKDSPRRGFG